ncbi:MAG: UDP-N-acetylmuramoyl-tripeptide--D-alanyl-D-alanine ligase [Spirochaetota bacterium]
MSGLTFDTIVRWLTEDGHLVSQVAVIGAPLPEDVSVACVDSRLARPRCLFVALPGERTDGHAFIDHAVQGGATVALVAADRLAAVRKQVFGSVRLVPVDDTLAALQSLAKRWRIQFPALKRIGITGSNGKTTTKELLASVLGLAGSTVYSHGNHNSDIGLPLELLRIREEHVYGVFEMGMNRVGEIRQLAELVEPDIGVITNVGRAHIGMVGTQEGIAREKRQIFSTFSGRQIAVIPASDRFASLLGEGVEGEVVRYSMASAGVTRVEHLGIDGALLHCDEGAIRLLLPGAQMVMNALAVMTVARLLDIPFALIGDGIERVEPVFGRAEVIRGPVTVIQDCYNANPESMRSALELLASVETEGRRLAILGSMKELGPESAAAHAEVVELASEFALDLLWFVGDEFAEAVGELGGGASGAVRAFRSDEWDRLVGALVAIEPGDTVLLKGSRAVALERLTPVLMQTGGAA